MPTPRAFTPGYIDKHYSPDIQFKADFAHVCKDALAGLFLTRCHVWCKSKRQQAPNDPDAWWFWQTRERWLEETAMSRRELEHARSICVRLGFVEVRHGGEHNRTWYRVHYEALGEALVALEVERDGREKAEAERQKTLKRPGRPRKGARGEELLEEADRPSPILEADERTDNGVSDIQTVQNAPTDFEKSVGTHADQPVGAKSTHQLAQNGPTLTLHTVFMESTTSSCARAHDDPATAVVDLLTAYGVTPTVAQDLDRTFPHDLIRHQVAVLPFRNPKDPAATLCRAIRESWAEPQAYRDHLEEQERLANQRRFEVRERAAEQERRAQEQERERRLDLFYESLSLEEQTALEDQAREIVLTENAFLAPMIRAGKNSAPVRGAIHAQRRKLLEERLSDER